jgi:hypothetical protein
MNADHRLAVFCSRRACAKTNRRCRRETQPEGEELDGQFLALLFDLDGYLPHASR